MQAGDEDGWDEALGYMDACGPGWHLQIARTTSDDGLANESLRSLSNCMLSDSTRSVSRLSDCLSESSCCSVVCRHRPFHAFLPGLGAVSAVRVCALIVQCITQVCKGRVCVWLAAHVQNSGLDSPGRSGCGGCA